MKERGLVNNPSAVPGYKFEAPIYSYFDERINNIVTWLRGTRPYCIRCCSDNISCWASNVLSLRETPTSASMQLRLPNFPIATLTHSISLCGWGWGLKVRWACTKDCFSGVWQSQRGEASLRQWVLMQLNTAFENCHTHWKTVDHLGLRNSIREEQMINRTLRGKETSKASEEKTNRAKENIGKTKGIQWAVKRTIQKVSVFPMFVNSLHLR